MATTWAVAPEGLWPRTWQTLARPHGDRRWDVFLRATAAVALLGIPIVLLFEGSVTYVWLAVLSLPANSPLSPILPTFFEPIIIEAAKWKPAWAVTLVATSGYMYMEYINWHVYAWVLNWDRMDGFRSRRSVRWGVQMFSRSPFWMVVVFAFTPLPFWAGRALAILHHYPLGRFMVATAVGRVPRWLFYAWFGSRMNIPVWILLAVIVIPAGIVIGGRLLRGESLSAEVAAAPSIETPRLRDHDSVVP